MTPEEMKDLVEEYKRERYNNVGEGSYIPCKTLDAFAAWYATIKEEEDEG